MNTTKTSTNIYKEFIIKCKNPDKCYGDILFIHGYCVDHTYFVAAENLSRYFNIYMIDLPGHGVNTEGYKPKDLTFKKMSQYIVDYVDYKKINNFILMGHSMGGGLSSWVANMIPKKIRKLILVSPYNVAIYKIFKFIGFKSLRIFSPTNMEEKYELLDILYKDYTKYINDPQWVKMNEKQLKWQLANWKNMKKLGAHLQSLSTILKTKKRQENININTLLLVGERDRAICGYSTIKNFKKYFKNKSLQTYMFQNSGHLCFEEEQSLFIEKVLEFIK